MPIRPFGKAKAARRARKPEISPTKIRIFLECLLMYKLIYVTKIGRYHYLPNAGDSFGGSLHRALHDFYAAGGHDTHTVDQFVERLDNTWISIGYGSRDEEREHREFGVRILEDFYTNSKSGARTLFTERQLREDMGDFVLIGRIDRLDARPDGALEIIDYKTGRESVTEAEVAFDLAMGIYQLLVKHKHPDRRVIATIHCLRTGLSASTELQPEALAELERFVREAASKLLAITEDMEIPPVRKDVCDGCQFFTLCERRARILGQEWEARKS